MSIGESDSRPLNSNGDTQEIKGYTERIRGLTLLKSKLYVTIERRNTVEVFDSALKMMKKKLTFESLADPGTMASCTKNNCIYIIDKKKIRDPVEIFKYRPGKKYASRWLTGVYGRLSVTKETGHVVLAAYMGQEKPTLKIFSTDGALLRTITFSKNTRIDYLWHAVELKQGEFVVSQGCNVEESLLHRVCIVRQDEKNIMKSFGSRRGRSIKLKNDPAHSIQILNEPSYLCVTAEGSILVTDMKNHRVLLLTKDLKFKKIVFEDGKHFPETMYFDEENGRLFLGSNFTIGGEGRVLCFPCTVE